MIKKRDGILFKASYLGGESSFKQPRQKIWGVFVVDIEKTKDTTKKWKLIEATNDYEKAKTTFNEWLREPESDELKFTGLDNIILTELLPADITSSKF
ncbi:hypothetical protein Bp8pS_137 [Bacillus phage vB_BpuM-BpSp]|nr:hypothetical protein Bp8pS_137 [Bacillus phage vB_BpuM-BpSp]